MVTISKVHDNKWTIEARMKFSGRPINAFDILAVMRPEVEKVLLMLDVMVPPSQSYRIPEALEILEGRYKNLCQIKAEETMAPEKLMEQRMRTNHVIKMLKDFLAVHRTVWILEGRPL